MKIPRCILGDSDNVNNVSLDTFCDASQYTYATVSFSRIQRRTQVIFGFLQAKSRVSLAKGSSVKHSIPRLELLAATIGARLSVSFLKAINFKDIKTYFCTDSSTVLAWIRRVNN